MYLVKRDSGGCEVNVPQYFPNLPNQRTHSEEHTHLVVIAIKQKVVASFKMPMNDSERDSVPITV